MNLEDITCPIHSFESFGAVDGPGIRYVIFTQGCNLKCKYCQNRDTWCHQGGTKYSVKEVLDKILRYKNYIIPSGGGVTVCFASGYQAGCYHATGCAAFNTN